MSPMKDNVSPTARALLALEVIQGSPGITADRLADKLGVSERAARRYVGILREAEIPIESVRGPYGGYRVGRGLRLPPLVFSAAEALGLVMAVLDGHHEAADPTDPVGGALGKIVRALPETVAAQAELVRRTAAPAPDRAAARPDSGITTELVEACTQHRRARLDYRSDAGSEWVAEVEPVGGRRTPRALVPPLPGPRQGRRARLPRRPGAVGRDARRDLRATCGPGPGRAPRGPPRGRLGVRRGGRHRRSRREGRSLRPPLARPARGRRRAHLTPDRQHRQPVLVRRAARRPAGPRSRCSAASSSSTRPAGSGSGSSPPVLSRTEAGDRPRTTAGSAAERHVVGGPVVARHRGRGRPGEVVVQHGAGPASSSADVGQRQVEAVDRPSVHLLVGAVAAVQAHHRGLVAVASRSRSSVRRAPPPSRRPAGRCARGGSRG